MCNPGDIVLEGGFSISTDPGADIDLSSLSSGPADYLDNNCGLTSNNR